SETERMTMESHLRKALENHEFVLNYQPMIDTRTGQITRVEALLRWDHPNLGIIPPLDFLPLAEEIGLIEYIGEWVIREACAQCKEWQNKGYTDLYMTVNISDREFRAQRFIDQLEEVVKDQGISKNYLEFELTEKIVVQDFEASISKLNRLREMGIKLALDDFGTGYSSLAYLKKLPLNTLKIDRSFVADVDESPEGTSIVASIIALAHTLNMYVVAEGVETEKQYQMLKSQGCDALQGYHISPPVPAKELLGLLKKYGVAPASRIA
ncbi:MAG: EAL domain-containing protein, partial [Gammaproteobacteria bacterium]|nr:EAL domain-containing protein [Gammaproteobacteria bacterium]